MLLALILVPIATAILFGAGGFYAGLTYRRKTAEAAIGSAEQEAKRIMEDAIKAAEAKRKKPYSKARMSCIGCATNRKKNSTTAARKSSGRSGASSRRKKPSIKSSKASNARKALSPKRKSRPKTCWNKPNR